MLAEPSIDVTVFPELLWCIGNNVSYLIGANQTDAFLAVQSGPSIATVLGLCIIDSSTSDTTSLSTECFPKLSVN